MYGDITDIYLEIFPLNQAFLGFIREYLGEPGTAVLDLGCGPGDYVDQLTRWGYRATGIDSSARMIKLAQAEKRGTFFPYSFMEIDRLAGKFDCAYCVGNSLSYLSGSETPPFVNQVFDLLNSGSAFVIQVVNWDRFRAMRASDFPVKTLADGRTFHRRYEWIDDAHVIFHTELREGGTILGAWADRLSPKYMVDLVSALEAGGFTVTGQFGDYAKTPFDPQSSPATILTARK